ncbi:MAG: hypothetical protein JWM40_843 [Frankiales bacterium]|nr:hypothetical protein [Frankiales bacterium]
MRRSIATASLILLASAGLPLAHGTTAAAAGGCPAPPPLTFEPPQYVDKTRAGGEPLVATYPNGRLLYSSHAGTTHFFAPDVAAPGSAAFVENYTGQTYIWTSDDNGKTWTFRPRTIPTEGLIASGFSDPEIAIDSAGQVFFSEINLVNVAVSKSTTKGSTWTLQNLGGAVLTDRQWTEADRKDELYFVANGQPGGTGTGVVDGHYISKSTDGGKTFTNSIPDQIGGSGLGDIRVDKRNGTVYEAHYSQGNLAIAAFRNARAGNLVATDTSLVAAKVRMVAHWPAIDLDPSGNLYITWDEDGTGGRAAGIWYSRSTDAGRHWADPVRVSSGDATAIWPWLGVGDDGRAGIAWLQADRLLPSNDPQTPGSYGWRIVAAATTTGLGCTASTKPAFTAPTVATPAAVHVGTICNGGTVCQATLTDRRLGDYFSVDVDNTGRMYMGYSDTQVPAAVSLPAFVRQQSGPSLLVPESGGAGKPTATTGQAPAKVPPSTLPKGGKLAATGLGDFLPAWAALVLMVGLLGRRRIAATARRGQE